MLLYTKNNEMRCILALTSPKVSEADRSTLLGKLNESHFEYGPCSVAFNRITKVAKKRHQLVDFDDLLEDPAVDEDIRDIFRNADVKAPKKTAFRKIVRSLDEYRKLRALHAMASNVLRKMKDDSVEDVDALLNAVGDDLAKARKDLNEDQTIVRIGKKDNAKELVHDALHKARETLIATGFTEYDEKNGGLPEQGVMILGATTSGGKTATLMNLCKNLYLDAKRSVCRLSLEMSERQEMHRMLSMLTGIPFWKFKRNKLSPKEKKTAKKAYDKFLKFGKKHGCQYDFVCPTRGMTITESLAMLKPFGYDVIGIDYISLLEGVDEDNQWRILSAIARECKVFSRETGCLVILLCQIDDETNKLRYSKGVKEHADVMWSWNYSKPEQRELKTLPIKVDKARDGELFDFDLEEAFEFMQVRNPEGAGSGSFGDASDDMKDGVNLKPTSDGSDESEDASDDYALK